MSRIEDEFWAMSHWLLRQESPTDTTTEAWAKWKSLPPEEIEFKNYREVLFAAMGLKGDSLPPAARVAVGDLLFKVVGEALEKSLNIECMGIFHDRGRKRNTKAKVEIVYSVSRAIHEGCTKTEAYTKVAKQRNKSPETIRRLYERVEQAYKAANREK